MGGTRVGDLVDPAHGLRQRPSEELKWTELFADYEPEPA
jgi:hypothetical protein